MPITVTLKEDTEVSVKINGPVPVTLAQTGSDQSAKPNPLTKPVRVDDIDVRRTEARHRPIRATG